MTRHVLVVDDSAAMRRIVVRTLRQAGFSGLRVTEAGDGVSAFEQICTQPPQLVLSDWHMPRMNGLELLEALNRREDRVPFGFITAESSPSMRDVAERCGALFLIAKPFSVECFQEVLGPVLAAWP